MTVVDMRNVFGLETGVDFDTPNARLVFEGEGNIRSEEEAGMTETKPEYLTITIVMPQKRLDELKGMI